MKNHSKAIVEKQFQRQLVVLPHKQNLRSRYMEEKIFHILFKGKYNR